MKKKVPVVTVAGPEGVAQLAGLPLEATVALADLATAVKDGLLAMCADVGLMVMAQVMEDELTRRIGPKHAKLIDRTANWHGTTTGSVVLGGGGQRVEEVHERLAFAWCKREGAPDLLTVLVALTKRALRAAEVGVQCVQFYAHVCEAALGCC